MSRITSEKNTAEYNTHDRSGVEILADGACNRNLLTIVGLGGDFTAGTVEVYIKGRGSRRYLAMKDAYGNAVSINLATADAVMIDKPIGSVMLDVSGISGVTGWMAVLSGIDEPMSVASSSVTGPVIVGGASPDHSEPTANPVGVSGIDGSGLTRSLLTDSIGQMMTTEQDSEVLTASASSASVLFTVDMTNWRSVLLHVTNAGSGCTIAYEGSNDQLAWVPVSALNSAIGTTSNPAVTTSTFSALYQIPKRGKYLRARVSVYGSGTVSVAYTATAEDVSPAMSVCAWGPTSEGGSAGGNPVAIGLEARTATKTVVTNGQVVRPIGTTDGRMVVRPHSVPELEGFYAAPSGGLLNATTALTIKGATANLRTFITSIQLQSEVLTNATELVIRDGSGGTVLWRVKIPTTGLDLKQIDFEDPLKSSVNTLIEYATLTASGTGAVYLNAQWYQAP